MKYHLFSLSTIFAFTVVFSSPNNQQFEMDYSFTGIMESMNNVSGGLEKGSVLNVLGQFELNINYTETKILGSFLWLNGENPSSYIGDGFGVSNMHGYNSFRLFEFWIERSFLNKKTNVRIGSLLADTEFSVNEIGGFFLNSAFGWPAYISGNTLNAGPAFFVTAPGFRLHYQLNDNQYLKAGIYDGDAFDNVEGDGELTAHGMHWEISKAQGFFSIIEYGRLAGNTKFNTLKIGFWNYNRWLENEDLIEKKHGLYGATEYQPTFTLLNKNLKYFLRSGISTSSNSQLYQYVIDCGINLIDPFSHVQDDVFGIGVVYGKLSHGDSETDLDLYLDYEMALEAALQFKLMNQIIFQPDIQWVFHPGGNSTIENAIVASLRLTVEL